MHVEQMHGFRKRISIYDLGISRPQPLPGYTLGVSQGPDCAHDAGCSLCIGCTMLEKRDKTWEVSQDLRLHEGHNS